MNEETTRAALVERAANAGAAVATASFRTGIAVETKRSKTDVVTQADRDAQRRVIEVIRESFPDDAVVGEEEDALKSVPESGWAWVVDPIDGTANYVRDLRTWATSVAVVHDGEAVAAANVFPALDDSYVSDETGVRRNGEAVRVSERSDPETFAVVPFGWWSRDRRGEYAAVTRELVTRFGDMRRPGCAQAVLSRIAAGSLDGAVTNVTVNPWDSVAGVHMVRQAGGTVTDVHGEPWRPGDDGLVASNGTGHDEFLAAVQSAGGN